MNLPLKDSEGIQTLWQLAFQMAERQKMYIIINVNRTMCNIYICYNLILCCLGVPLIKAEITKCYTGRSGIDGSDQGHVDVQNFRKALYHIYLSICCSIHTILALLSMFFCILCGCDIPN